MRARTPLLATVLALAAAYAAYPYVTLVRLGLAIYNGDMATLETLVDWPSVREGITEDICDQVIDTPVPSEIASNALPPFGASFVHGIAINTIAARISPATLVSAAQPWVVPLAPDSERGTLGWAFFATLSRFTVQFLPPGAAEPVTLRLRLRDGAWKVTRAWLPTEMLVRAKSQT